MARRFQITFDGIDPVRPAAFWADVLGYHLEPRPDDWLREIGIPEQDWDDGASIADPFGLCPPIYLQRVPEPKQVGNRAHLDVDVIAGRSVPLGARRQAVALGAREVAAHEEYGHYHVVMHDPDGNERCLR